MRKFFTVLITLFLAVFLNGQSDYIWPTNAPKLLSGTFGETRAGHFHSGIDIKTWAQVGYECYAIGNGYISKIVETPNGYGKVLYLNLDDGNTAVYSHLDGFNGKLETISYSIKLKEKTHLLKKEFLANEIRVRKGNLIAYTGGSGTRFPHLHFEIRDTANVPLNALKYGFPIEDDIPPEPEIVGLTPLNKDSEINSDYTTSLFKLEFFRNNIYVHKDTIQAKGTLGVELMVFDKALSNNKNAVYQITLYHQGKKRFEKTLDHFDFDRTQLINLDRNYRLSIEDKGDFHSLYSTDVSEVLDFYTPGLDGKIDILPGYQTIVIQLRDANNNRSAVKFVVYGGDYPKHIFKTNTNDASFTVELDTLYTKNIAKKYTMKLYNAYGHFESWQSFVPGENLKTETISLSLNSLKNKILSLEYEDSLAYISDAQFWYFNENVDPNLKDMNLKIQHYNEGIVFEIYSESILAQDILLAFEKNGFQTVPLHRKGLYSAKTDLIPLDSLKNIQSVQYYQRNDIEWVLKKHIEPVYIDNTRKKQWLSADSLFAAIFPGGGFYQPVLSWLENISGLPQPQGGEFVSSVYSLNPVDQPMNKKMSMAIKLPKDFPSDPKQGVYQYNVSKEEWTLVNNRAPDDERPYIQAYTNSGGIFAMIRDFEAPKILKSYPGNGGSYRGKDLRSIWFELEDNLSGFGDGSGIKIFVDGVWKVFYYNAVTEKISVDKLELSRGKHRLVIQVDDVAGNRLYKTINFTVI